MGGLIKTGGQIYTSNMQHLMLAILPQETAGYVIYFALAGYEGRCPIFAIVLGKFLFREPSHLQNLRMDWFRNIGETLSDAGPPLSSPSLL